MTSHDPSIPSVDITAGGIDESLDLLDRVNAMILDLTEEGLDETEIISRVSEMVEEFEYDPSDEDGPGPAREYPDMPYGTEEDHEVVRSARELDGTYPVTVTLTDKEVAFINEVCIMVSAMLNNQGRHVSAVLNFKALAASHGRDVAEALWRSSFPPETPMPETDA